MDGQGVLRRAIFLDRDGTLNKDTGYVHRKEDWHWLPGVVEALKRFHAVGYALVVVSNQSGLARGMYDLAALHELEAWINADLEAKGAAIDAWYYCPHLPEITGPCSCRKPAPGLILRAAYVKQQTIRIKAPAAANLGLLVCTAPYDGYTKGDYENTHPVQALADTPDFAGYDKYWYFDLNELTKE